MRKPTQEQIDRWVSVANSVEPIKDRAHYDTCRRLLELYGLGLDGKPDLAIARDAAATGARLPRGTVRVS